MSLYTFTCQTCHKEFDRIVKPGTKFEYCPGCGKIGIRERIELCSPAQIEDTTGAVYRPKYRERKYE